VGKLWPGPPPTGFLRLVCLLGSINRCSIRYTSRWSRSRKLSAPGHGPLPCIVRPPGDGPLGVRKGCAAPVRRLGPRLDQPRPRARSRVSRPRCLRSCRRLRHGTRFGPGPEGAQPGVRHETRAGGVSAIGRKGVLRRYDARASDGLIQVPPPPPFSTQQGATPPPKRGQRVAS